MVLVGIYHHIVLLDGAVQCVAHLHSVLYVYVVVGRAVHNEQACAVIQLVGKVDGRVLIISFRDKTKRKAIAFLFNNQRFDLVSALTFSLCVSSLIPRAKYPFSPCENGRVLIISFRDKTKRKAIAFLFVLWRRERDSNSR